MLQQESLGQCCDERYRPYCLLNFAFAIDLHQLGDAALKKKSGLLKSYFGEKYLFVFNGDANSPIQFTRS